MRTVFLCEDIFIPDAYKISKTGFCAIDRAFKKATRDLQVSVATFLSSPHLCFIIIFICDLFVSRDDPLMIRKPPREPKNCMF